MHITLEQTLHTVVQRFRDDDGEERNIDILVYIDEGDSVTFSSCQQGLPDGREPWCIIPKKDLQNEIENEIRRLQENWGTPIQTVHGTAENPLELLG